MDAVNTTLTLIADWLFGWSGPRWPLVTLLLWSAVAGFLMTVVFGYSSNQRAVKLAAERSRAQALAIKLFGDDPAIVLSSLFQLLRYTGLRLWHSLPPVLVMFVPITLILAQLAARYEHRPLGQGESAIVKLELSEQDWPIYQNVSLEALPQVAIETPALRDTAEHAIYWRVRPTQAAPGVLRWRVGDDQVEKSIEVSAEQDRLTTVSTRRPGRGWWDRLLHPVERALPKGSPIRGIQIDYPPRETPFAGVNIPWWLTFVVTSMVAAFAAGPLLRVRF